MLRPALPPDAPKLAIESSACRVAALCGATVCSGYAGAVGFWLNQSLAEPARLPSMPEIAGLGPVELVLFEFELLLVDCTWVLGVSPPLIR